MLTGTHTRDIYYVHISEDIFQVGYGDAPRLRRWWWRAWLLIDAYLFG